MTIISLLVFAAIAGISIASSSASDATIYNLSGMWYVAAVDAASTLNIRCWEIEIATTGRGLHGTGVTHFLDSRSRRRTVDFRFSDIVASQRNPATFRVNLKPSPRFGRGGIAVLKLIDDDTMILYNTYQIKKLEFEFLVLSRNPSRQFELAGLRLNEIDNSCAIWSEPDVC